MRKITLLFLIALAYIGVSGQSLFFSEYLEGNSNNKALEIYNATGAPVDLSAYVVKLGSNGGEWKPDSLMLKGTLDSAAVYVIANASADAAILSKADTTSTVTYYNGNDAVGLFKNGVLVDIIGVYGEDPGSQWAVAGISDGTGEHTLIRKSEVTTGKTDWAAIAGTDSASSEYIVYEQNNFSFIGWHITPPSNQANIEAFVLEEEIAAAIINLDDTTVTTTVSWDAVLADLEPEITVSEGAQVTATTLPVVFNGVDAVEYKVTAADGSFKLWDVMVYQAAGPKEVAIYDIQYTDSVDGDSPLADSLVMFSGIVTGVQPKGFYVQDAKGAWNGVFVYHNGTDTVVVVNDSVTVTGTVKEYYNLTEVTFPGLSITVEASDKAMEATVVTPADFTEAYEAVYVKVENVSCASEADGYGEWVIANATDSAAVGDELFAYEPKLYEVFTSITGPMTYTFSEYKLLPRDSADIVSEGVPNVAVTLNVDMTKAELVDGDVVYVTGTFNGWVKPGDDGSTMMTAGADNIYTATINVPMGTGAVEYKYFKNASWDNGDPNNNGANRQLTVETEALTVNDIWAEDVSVNENALSLVSMYPNPFNSTLTINNMENVTEIRVSNILGQTVMTVPVTASSMDLSTDNLEKGIYLITIIDMNNDSRTERVVKR